MPKGERASKGNNADKTAVFYLPKIPGSTVYAVCRPNIDAACIVEHILLSLRLISQEDDITWSKKTSDVSCFAHRLYKIFLWKAKLGELVACNIHTK